ncbi:MAG: YHS domain-containing protein [Candidatus Omnitrophica bacterium]|nr:YHS domain-containing protein [Candidatus Omnitrophota bacterium]
MGDKVKDLVCGMEIEKDTAKGPVEHMGQKFYFCSPGCREKFEKEPMKYMSDK